MAKATIRSLTRKGWSQKKIALTLHIRKSKVVAYQKAKRIGKRAVPTGAREFWEDVKAYKKIFQVKHKTAITEVKYTKKWYLRRKKKALFMTMEDWKEQYEYERRLTEPMLRMYKEEEAVGATPR